MPASVPPDSTQTPDYSIQTPEPTPAFDLTPAIEPAPAAKRTSPKLVLNAVAQQDAEGLRALLQTQQYSQAVDLSVCDSEGRTPLNLAVELGQRAMVKMLLQAGAEVQVGDRDGQTPLMRAATVCDLKLVRWLLKQGADPNTISADGDTALILAASATHWQKLEESAAASQPNTVNQSIANPDITSQGIVRQTPDGPMQLCPLPAGRVVAVLSCLIKHGADPNLEQCSATPLMEAARYGQGAVIEFLLKAGADPAVTASDGEAALDIAKIYNQTEAIALLETASVQSS